MKKQFFTLSVTFLILSMLSGHNSSAQWKTNPGIQIADSNLYNTLRGKIILRVEENGEAYYVHPEKQRMYFLGRPDDAFQIMREQGLGITTDNLTRITTIDSVKNYGHDINLAEKLKGRILLQVEQNGEAWYINPSDTHRYFLGRPADAFNIMRNLGIGISDENFEKMKQTSVLDYQNNEYGFEFSYPKNLEVLESEKSVIKLVEKDCENLRCSIDSILIEKNNDNSSIDDLIKNIKNKHTLSSEYTETEMIIDDVAAHKIVYADPDGYYIVFIKDGYIFEINGDGRIEEEGIISTFRFSNNINPKNELATVLEEISFEDTKYRAYEDKVTKIADSQEYVIYQTKQNDISFIKENPNLKLSPSGYILFFDYFKGDSTCRMNALQLDSNALLWDDSVGCGADIYWSPDNKQVALVWNHYDGLNLSISTYGDIKNLSKKFEVFYPSEAESTNFYWKSNDVFVFEPNEEYFDLIKDSFEENNLSLGINEFITR